MKLAKRIFVGILSVAMLVCSVMLPASAEDAPMRPMENYYDLFEYIRYDTYLVEDYETQVDETYVYDSSFVYSAEAEDGETVQTPYFAFVSGKTTDGEAETTDTNIRVVSEGENKYLKILSNSTKPAGYKMYPQTDSVVVKDFVTSFNFKSGDSDGTNGSNLTVTVTRPDYFEEITLFAANMADDSAKEFLYAEYDDSRVTYSTAVADAQPQLDTWYNVEILYVLEGSEEDEYGFYTITVTSGDSTVFSFTDSVYKSETGIDSLRIYVSNPEDAGETVTCFDELVVYEGTAVRDVKNSVGSLSVIAKKIHEYATHDLTSIEDRIEVAEFYADFYGGEGGIANVAPDLLNSDAELKALSDGWMAYRNNTKANAIITYADVLAKTEGYYEQLAYIGEYVQEYYDFFAENSNYAELEGIKDVTVGDSALADKLAEAIKTCDKISNALITTQQYCIAFVKNIEDNYDPDNKDFGEMTAKYESLSVLVGKVDPVFKYSEINSATKYPTVADALAEYRNLGAKIEAIVKNASEIFIPAVDAMKIEKAESVSAESPYLTTNFKSLYENYLVAKSVYFEGSVHESLDPATYEGLEVALAKYEEYRTYVESRIAESSAFVAAVKGAESSFYHVTIKAQLEEAKLYLDENIEKSLEEYVGVAEAIALYAPLCKKLEQSEKDADAYITAVAAINLDADYSTLKAAVTNIAALKAKFNLIGYKNLEEANSKYAKAEAKVASLEGNSSTLIAVVKQIKDATTLAERRSLIYTALNALENSEATLSGVSAAKTELEGYVAQYNEDVAKINALFATVVGNAYDFISSAAPTDAVVGSADVAAAIIK